MKKTVFLSAMLLAFAATTNAQAPQGDANIGDIYGAGATIDNAKPLSQVAGTIDTVQTPVKITAKVLDVCPKKGCWLKLAIDDSTTAFVKMKDYAFFLPTAIKGKNIVLDGVAFQKTTSVAELKHYAEDAKKPQEAINAITRPQKELRLIANGIKVIQ